MPDRQDWNRTIIEEFRANEGRVGGTFSNMPLLLVHHTGSRTGTVRVNPVAYQKLDAGWAVFASKGGFPKHPDWYRNLKANPKATIEVGTETIAVAAREATGEERERIWSAQKERHPQFAEYEVKTKGIRDIPVMILEPVG